MTTSVQGITPGRHRFGLSSSSENYANTASASGTPATSQTVSSAQFDTRAGLERDSQGTLVTTYTKPTGEKFALDRSNPASPRWVSITPVATTALLSTTVRQPVSLSNGLIPPNQFLTVTRRPPASTTTLLTQTPQTNPYAQANTLTTPVVPQSPPAAQVSWSPVTASPANEITPPPPSNMPLGTPSPTSQQLAQANTLNQSPFQQGTTLNTASGDPGNLTGDTNMTSASPTADDLAQTPGMDPMMNGLPAGHPEEDPNAMMSPSGPPPEMLPIEESQTETLPAQANKSAWVKKGLIATGVLAALALIGTLIARAWKGTPEPERTRDNDGGGSGSGTDRTNRKENYL